MSYTLFRLYTESSRTLDTNTLRIASEILKGFTAIHATGYWQGKAEDSLIIETVVNSTTVDTFRVLVRVCADRIALANEQDSVLVTEQPISAEFRTNPSLEFPK